MNMPVQLLAAAAPIRRSSKSLLPLLLLSALPVVVQAQSYTNAYGIWTYTTANRAITITAYTGPGGDVTIPDRIPDTSNGLPVTCIGDYTFHDNYSLTTVSIPKSVTKIGHYAFSWCINLASVTIPEGVTSIGFQAFYTCISLAGVTIPNNVSSIGEDAFDGCSSLTSVKLSTNVTVIGYKTFAYCSSLTGLTIPSSVTNIGWWAFEGCSSLASVTIPDSVISIGPWAFYSCTSLARAKIGTNATSIGGQAFSGCTSLQAITVDPRNSVYSDVDGVLFNRSLSTLVTYPGGIPGSYTIPSSVTGIGDWAFDYCAGLTSISIPDRVTSIGGWAFDYCTSLTSLSIPDRVSNIGGGAFYGCSSLASVTIPNSVTNIEQDAFSDCYSLTGVYFQGNAPTPVDDCRVFSGAFNATAYYLPGTTGWGATFDCIPTAPWFLPHPLILRSPSFGVKTNLFGFVISWATNTSVVVEACINLANPVWQPVATNTLISGSSYFSDPQWTDYPARFYRIRSR
jgi:hypothetical protein